MADAPKTGKQAGKSSAPSGKTAAAKTNKAAPKVPTEGEAQAQTPVLNGIHPGANGLPTLLSPFQARDELAKALGDLEQTVSRVENGLSGHFDLTGLRRHLEGARKWFANELGLEVENGQVVRGDGGTQLSTPGENAGTTGDESSLGKKQLEEANKNRAQAEKDAKKND